MKNYRWLLFNGLVLLVLFIFSGCRPSLRPSDPDSSLSYRVLDLEKLAQVRSIQVQPTNFSLKQESEIWAQFFDAAVVKAWEKETALEVLIQKPKEVVTVDRPDAQLFTEVSLLQQRLGSKVGALRGARVMFTQKLRMIDSGQVVWQATFVDQDRALTENLFDANSGKWDRVEDIVKRGVSKAAQSVDRELRQFYRSKHTLYR